MTQFLTDPKEGKMLEEEKFEEDGDDKLPEELEDREEDDYDSVPDDEIDQPDPNVEVPQ